MEIRAEHETPDEGGCTIVCAPMSQFRTAIKEKLKEGWVPLGPPFATGATVNLEGQEVLEMGQAMMKREALP